MSLFKARDIWTAQCGEDESFDQSNLVITTLGGQQDKIIVGSHSGFLRVFQPSLQRNDEGKTIDYIPTDLLIEVQLPRPILQLDVGKLVSGSQNQHLCILHPRSVAVYSFISRSGAAEHGDQNRFILAYEHQLQRSAFSIVLGPFGGVAGRDFICVQSLDGTLSFYEQETFAFCVFLPGFLLPGPIAYIPFCDSFVTVSSNFHVERYRYQVLAESGERSSEDTSKGRKISADWTYNLGECALDVRAIMWGTTNCDIVILGEHNLFCLKDNGSLKFMKRFQYKPCCFHPYFVEPDGRLMILVVSDTNTLLVYDHTRLRWSAQLLISPIAITRGSFEITTKDRTDQKMMLNGVIVLLTETGQLQCCYLGTEPMLFIAPPLEIHAIDYNEAANELGELQKMIKHYTKTDAASLASTAAERELKVSVYVSSQLEPCPFPHNVEEQGIEVPMCRVSVELLPHAPLSKVQVSVIVQPPLRVSQVSHTITSLCERSYIVAYVYIEHNCDIPTLEVRIVTSYMATSGGYPRVVHNLAQLPLKLVTYYCPPAKEADYKITLNTNKPVVAISQLFPEFAGEGALSATSSAAGFQCFGGRGCAVTILAAKSSQRYRLQSDTLPSLCLLTTELVERLYRYFSKETDFECSYSSSLPLHELFAEIGSHFMFRERARKIQEVLGQRSSQFRVIQRRLLSKFKDKTPTPLTNLDVLLKETYQQILASADEMEEIQHALYKSRCQLRCITCLILLMLKLMHNTPESDYSDLQAVLGCTINETEEQGWEEVTDAALSYLLRTSLTKASKTNQRLTPITLDPMKDIARFKKHISSALDRASKGSYEWKDNKQAKPISPIPERQEDSYVPVGSQFGERAVSAKPRGRSAALLQARQTLITPSKNTDTGEDLEAAGPSQEQQQNATPALESPPEDFSSVDDDIW